MISHVHTIPYRTTIFLYLKFLSVGSPSEGIKLWIIQFCDFSLSRIRHRIIPVDFHISTPETPNIWKKKFCPHLIFYWKPLLKEKQSNFLAKSHDNDQFVPYFEVFKALLTILFFQMSSLTPAILIQLWNMWKTREGVQGQFKRHC